MINSLPRYASLVGIGCVFLLGMVAACTPEPKLPDLRAIYAQEAAAQDGGTANLLITIPGTLGSRLVDSVSGKVIWGGGSEGISADPENPVDARLMALPIVPSTTSFAVHRDTIVPDGVLDTAQASVLGLPVDIDVYGGIRRMLSLGGFRARTVHLEDRTIFARAGPEGDTDRSETASEILTTLPEATQNRAPDLTPADYSRLTEDQANEFRFDYDWRRDIATLAAEFHRFVELRKREVAAERSLIPGQSIRPEDVRFDLLAHSMGGLVARYYLMYGDAPLGEKGALPPVTWAGARNFNRVIFIAPPNAGSIVAMDNLVNGKELGPFQPFYPAALLATHSAAWQLLPRTRHRRVTWSNPTGPDDDPVEIYDPKLWERMGWGLASPDASLMLEWLLPDVGDPAARRKLALDYQARLIRRAERFHRAMDRWRPPPANLELYLVVGGGFATPASGVVDRETGVFRITGVEEGDGVVLRSSALLDERQGHSFKRRLDTPLRFKTILFLPDEHVELTRDPVFGDNLLFWLLEQPRPPATLRRANAPAILTAHMQADTPDTHARAHASESAESLAVGSDR